MIRTVLKYGIRFLECFVAFLFSYLIVVLFCQSFKVGEIHNKGEITMFVRSNGIHTDVCFPSESSFYDWTKFIYKEDFPKISSFEHITIGWGDKGFFLDTPTWAELKTSTALNAVFLPSPTAMHVAYSERPIESENCVSVKINKIQYLKMIKYIQSCFEFQHQKKILIKEKGYADNDNFYEAKGSYHLFKTCNSWTNKVLRTGNIYTSSYAFFPNGIMEGLK